MESHAVPAFALNTGACPSAATNVTAPRRPRRVGGLPHPAAGRPQIDRIAGRVRRVHRHRRHPPRHVAEALARDLRRPHRCQAAFSGPTLGAACARSARVPAPDSLAACARTIARCCCRAAFIAAAAPVAPAVVRPARNRPARKTCGTIAAPASAAGVCARAPRGAAIHSDAVQTPAAQSRPDPTRRTACGFCRPRHVTSRWFSRTARGPGPHCIIALTAAARWAGSQRQTGRRNTLRVKKGTESLPSDAWLCGVLSEGL